MDFEELDADRPLRLMVERKRAGVTQKDLELEVCIPGSMISLMERGRLVPTSRQLLRIADAIGWSGEPMELLDEV